METFFSRNALLPRLFEKKMFTLNFGNYGLNLVFVRGLIKKFNLKYMDFLFSLISFIAIILFLVWKVWERRTGRFLISPAFLEKTDLFLKKVISSSNNFFVRIFEFKKRMIKMGFLVFFEKTFFLIKKISIFLRKKLTKLAFKIEEFIKAKAEIRKEKETKSVFLKNISEHKKRLTEEV